MLYGHVNFPKKPDVLAERAREILAGAGYAQTPSQIVYSLGWNNDYFERGPRNQDLNRVIPSPVVFYYRESPRPLVALGPEFRFDAPLTITHMANLEIDPRGRLIRFTVVPPQVEEPVRKAVDWSPYIAMTGIDTASLRPAPPKWRSPVDSDAKVGWVGGGLRIEAASKNGKPVWFSVIPPWQQAERATFVGLPDFTPAGEAILAIIGMITLLTALLLARRNLRRSRGDRKGAFRLAFLLIVLTFCMRVFRVDHVSDIAQESRLVGQLLGEALTAGAAVAVMYLAVEPYFRRRWPRMLIGWTRLMAGRFRDPIIGRDALIGAVAGCAAGIIAKLPSLTPMVGPMRTSFSALTELRHLTYLLLWSAQLAVALSLLTASMFLLLRIATRSSIAAVLLLVPVQVAMIAVNGNNPLQIVSGCIVAIMMVAVFRRYGLFALTLFGFFLNLATLVPLTLDTSVWYFGRSLFTIALMCAIAAYAFWISLAAQPAFGMALLEEE
jgi:serine/threonine-protein kinase